MSSSSSKEPFPKWVSTLPPQERKMAPYEFWEKIGSPKTVVAPMVDNSDLAFRMQTRMYGADICFTQMFNSNSFVNSKETRANLFQIDPEDRPLIVQISGHDPQTMLAAAKMVEDHCDAIDINLGCPQGIAKRGMYGAFLMEELALLDEIVRTMVAGLKVPVICKSRIYKDFDQTIQLYETLVNAGASALTVHGRTRDQKGQLVGCVDWDTIARIKKHFSEREIPIPIIANGGIENMDDVMRCLEHTKVDAVMSSEAILENPALFSRNLSKSGVYQHPIDLAEEYLALAVKYPVFHMRILRSHIMKMLYRYIAIDTDLRNRMGCANKVEQYVLICHELRVQIEEHQAFEDKPLISWYNRHKHGLHSFDTNNNLENECSDKQSVLAECSEEDENLFDAFSLFQLGGGDASEED